MNVGIQDAHNLGWKRPRPRTAVPEVLLDTYHTERHPVGVQLMEHSRAQTAVMATFTPEGLALRSLLDGMIATRPEFGRALSERLTGHSVGYPAADPGAHPLTGTRAPGLAVTGTDRRC
ncbi:FAD-dependent monooxygenase [Streptomyces sp. IBSNAI002]|uniref:FAD-dependent monooxygenase n=1 Tax=Streptomyces sp. IBSNAI002 TaxID=3457500 RepID=UPI003FD49191